MGCLGSVARASGIRTDARLEYPTTALPVTEITEPAGDVLARYTVRRDEFAASVALAGYLVESHTGPTEYTTPRAKIVDPSWFNWPALPVAMADTIVPNFPLTNKSFNLSYAGNDL